VPAQIAFAVQVIVYSADWSITEMNKITPASEIV
jgi:hypothetical protein